MRRKASRVWKDSFILHCIRPTNIKLIYIRIIHNMTTYQIKYLDGNL